MTGVLADHGLALRVDYADAGSRVLVAVDADGSTVGMASGGVCREGGDHLPAAAWELYSINLVRSVRGTGLADELLAAVLGGRAACVWVLADNARAQAFYRRHGFVADGGRRPHRASGASERRMVRGGR